MQTYQQYIIISPHATDANFYVFFLVATEGKNASPVYDSKQCGF